MGKLILYGFDPSPPVRACLLTLKELNLPFEYKIINVLKREQHTQEYRKRNPQHTIPTLEDDGHYISDSHAIMAYLVSKYGKDDALYPKDLLKRAIVDHRMYFEAGVMFENCLRSITTPILFRNCKEVSQYKLDGIQVAYKFLEGFLQNSFFMAGNHLTIADFSIISTITSLVAYCENDELKFPKLAAWMKRMKSLPYYDETNGKGADELVAIIKSIPFVIVP